MGEDNSDVGRRESAGRSAGQRDGRALLAVWAEGEAMPEEDLRVKEAGPDGEMDGVAQTVLERRISAHPSALLRYKVYEPILVIGPEKLANIDIRLRVKGGGHVSQLYALRQAIAKGVVA
jgi:hypothetical protein